jgi:hypothetical protein
MHQGVLNMFAAGDYPLTTAMVAPVGAEATSGRSGKGKMNLLKYYHMINLLNLLLMHCFTLFRHCILYCM